MAAQRAINTKDYLVMEKQIDASRLETDSAVAESIRETDRAALASEVTMTGSVVLPDGRRRPVWLTEMGWATHVPHNALGQDFQPNTQRAQAEDELRNMATSQARNLTLTLPGSLFGIPGNIAVYRLLYCCCWQWLAWCSSSAAPILPICFWPAAANVSAKSPFAPLWEPAGGS